MSSDIKPTISFVIPHQGRIPLLIETLRSIAELDNIETVAEVLVISREFNTDRGALAEQYNLPASMPPVRILKPTAPATIAAMRNQGAAVIQSDYIAFLDADIYLTSNWLTIMYSLAQAHPHIVLHSAVQQPDAGNSVLHRIRSILSQNNIGTDLKSLPGANLFMSRERFNYSDKFDATLISCEDMIFSTSLLKFGPLQLTGKAAFIHLGEDKNLKQLFRKEMFRGESNLFTLRFDKKLLRELPSILAPLLTTLSLISIPVLLLTGGAASTLLFALFLFVAPVVLYTLRFKTIQTTIRVSTLEIIVFYSVYFTGRGAGMLTGPFKRLFSN